MIVPSAKTRPGTGFGPIPWSDELAEWLHPRLVAPLVGWLAHADCPLSGECLSMSAAGTSPASGSSPTTGSSIATPPSRRSPTRVDELIGGPTTPMESAGGAMAAMFRDYPGPR